MEKNSFEQIAKKYADLVDKKPIHIFYERPNLLSLLPSNLSNLKILDLGCGSGWYAQYLTKAGAYVTAIDNSPTMVEITKKHLENKGDVYQADLDEDLGFLQDQSFDIIIAPLVIHYVKNWNTLFYKLAKKIKKSGNFIFSTHNPYIEYTLFNLENYFEKVKIVDEWKDIGKVEFYHHTLHELSEALYKSGFIIEQLLEPQPLEEMQTIDPQTYNNLKLKPWFLFIKTIKQ